MPQLHGKSPCDRACITYAINSPIAHSISSLILFQLQI
jgi:hypothetical protein